MATTLRHEFYETDDKLTLSIFDKGADAGVVQVKFEPRKFTYTNGEKSLVLEPLKGQITTDASDYTVGKVKVEVRFKKTVLGRWGGLIGDSPDPLANSASSSSITTTSVKPRKNWEGITTEILSSEKEKSTEEDANIYGDADEDTKRAMMKSYSESGGTTLSTNWGEVKQGKVEVKPPAGSEWKKWN
ncbi:SGS domain-containing protein [Mycena olivaceomarginata]|nr:SGS domain-containing protein [Mycena olivaceomarginata]